MPVDEGAHKIWFTTRSYALKYPRRSPQHDALGVLYECELEFRPADIYVLSFRPQNRYLGIKGRPPEWLVEKVH